MRRPIETAPRRRVSVVLAVLAAFTFVSIAALSVPASAFASPPANDNFANAQQLSGDTGSVAGTTREATFQPGEPDPVGGGSSVWYRWTAPSSGWATVHTCGGSLDTVLAVYTGSQVSALTLIGASDDACGMQSRVSWQAVAGTVYQIAVDGYFGDWGDFTLTWNRNPPPPVSTTDPTITGTPMDLLALTGSSGGWSGVEPITLTYAWGRCDASLNCGLIAGATGQTYTLTSADVGYRIYFRVTATNAGGETNAFSALTASVAPHIPAVNAAPIVNGTTVVGDVLLATPGTWIGTQPISLTYQWQRCDAALACSDLTGQTGTSLPLTEDLVGSRIRVAVTAANVAGSATATSEPTAAVRKPDCVVPNVRGKTASAAGAALRRANCAPGRVRRAFSKQVRAGRVISQSPRAGRTLPNGAKVGLVISKGKKR
jgi:PASTA domain